ncbi:hypothetical protein GCM10027022_00680 [Alpinimonas psychrophila]|uniref:Diguanylate cyclase (GGDEF)-like protein/PAS domain S-box-containing protein n=1 Tax=Alpinimonas psychrophila TaxID=748908 RepID=A0A7W3PPZ0_9MICO|nr:sensor domain-containing diguanylate cyclase [Alpinimonas psychrophila]MBA8829935.1 diguanylate cyclase (GGDEF)-like protein/PAS domain S-box-containing protein [Alpinimonas psychrophila]
MQLIGRIGAGLVGTMALVILVGWYNKITLPTLIWPGAFSMKPITALALLFLAVAVITLGRRILPFVLGVTVAAIGAVTLTEYIFGLSSGIDELIPGINFDGETSRMAPATALALLLLGASVVASRLKLTTLMLGLIITALCVSQIALQGYAYDVSSLYALGGLVSMALHSALGVTVLSLSLLLQHPSVGPVSLLQNRESAGKLLRPGILFIIFGPFALGWLILWAQRQGWFDTAFGVAILVLSMTVLGCGLIVRAAVGLRELDRQRDGIQFSLAEANSTLETTVEARTRELAEIVDKFRTVIQIAPVGIVQLNVEGGLVTANDQWLSLSGLTWQESLGDGWATALHPDDADRVLAEWKSVLSTGEGHETTLRFLTPEGHVNWVQVSTAPIRDTEQVSGYLATVTDITALRAAEARLKHLAFHDSLTNLPNRILLLDRLKQALLQAARHDLGVGVLFIDLDRFKIVNDSLGHPAGDAVLSEIAVRLGLGVRASDTVARVGGDEFVVVCPDIRSRKDVLEIADNLRKVIVEPIIIGNQIASVGASIGVVFGAGQDDVESLLGDADRAMYLAKGRERSSLQGAGGLG